VNQLTKGARTITNHYTGQSFNTILFWHPAGSYFQHFSHVSVPQDANRRQSPKICNGFVMVFDRISVHFGAFVCSFEQFNAES
jgi:hypothetical protein